MKKKLTKKEISNILSRKVIFDNLPENGKILYHIGKFRDLKEESSFSYLLSVVKQDIDNLKNNDKIFIKGYDADDIDQECRIMLVAAIDKYDPERGHDFRSYCRLLFKGRLISLLQETRRQKHIILNFSVSLSQSVYSDNDGNVVTYEDIIKTEDMDFLDFLCAKEYENMIKDKLNCNLSDLESSVYDAYISGYSYKEGSVLLNINKKSFGNAVQRVKTKIPEIFKDEIAEELKNNKKRTNKNRKKM